MKSTVRRLALAAAVSWTSAAWAQQADPATGTWKINLEKSKFNSAAPPKSMIVRIEASAKSQTVKSEATGADGKTRVSEYTANFDGKDYPLKGSMVADTVSLKRIDAQTIERLDKKAGKVVLTYTRVMAPDGKSFTVTVKGTNARGEPVSDVAVYEKQ